MQEGVLQDPNYAAWRDEITNEKRRAQTRELGGQTEGRNPKNLQSGDLKSQRKSSIRARKERKKFRTESVNASPRVKAKRLRGGEIDGFHRLLER